MGNSKINNIFSFPNKTCPCESAYISGNLKFSVECWQKIEARVLSHFVRDWAILSTRQMSTKINHGSVIRVTLNNISLRALIVQTTSTSAFTCHFQIKSRHYPSHFHSHCQLRLKKVDNSYICKVRLKKESCSQNTLLYPLLPKSNHTPPPLPQVEFITKLTGTIFLGLVIYLNTISFLWTLIVLIGFCIQFLFSHTQSKPTLCNNICKYWFWVKAKFC